MIRTAGCSIVLACLLLVALPVHAQVRFGWTTDCQWHAGEAAHLAIFEPAVDDADVGAAEGEPHLLGTIDCRQVVHTISEIARRPPSVPSITLVGYASGCVAPVREDVVLRVASRFESTLIAEETTVLAHRFDPGTCDDPGTLAIAGGEARIRFVRRDGALPPTIGALAPGSGGCGRRAGTGYEIPEARAWVALECGVGSPFLVQDGAVIAERSPAMQDVLAVLDVGERTFVQAIDVDSRHWIGELAGGQLVPVAADGVEVSLFVRHRADEAERSARYARERAASDTRDAWIGAAEWLAIALVLAGITFVVVRRIPRSGTRRPIDYIVTFVLFAYGAQRVLMGLLAAGVSLLFSSGSGGGLLPSPEPGWSALMIALGLGAACAGALDIAAALASLRQRPRAVGMVRVAIGVSIAFHVALAVAWSTRAPGSLGPIAVTAIVDLVALALASRRASSTSGA